MRQKGTCDKTVWGN